MHYPLKNDLQYVAVAKVTYYQVSFSLNSCLLMKPL